MQAISWMDPMRLSVVRSNDDRELRVGQILSVGRWMTALGAIRLACASAGSYSVFFQPTSTRFPSLSLASSGRFVIEDSPIALLCMAWPLAIGILVGRTCWPGVLRAAAATFFLLALSSILAIGADWSRDPNAAIQVGSFRVAGPDFAARSPKALALATLGIAQIFAELFAAGRSAWIARRLRRAAGTMAVDLPAYPEGVLPGNRRILIQVCWVFSLAFLVPVVRLPQLPGIHDLLDRSPYLRELLLRGDGPGNRRRAGGRSSDPVSLTREHEIQGLINRAAASWGERRYAEASDAYEKVIALYLAPDGVRDQQGRNNLALVENNLAWLLVTRPDPRPDDAEKAVENARRALASSPSDGNYWNTLGAAQYRAKNWQAAKDALFRSMELRGDGDGYDWILLAMVHVHTGRKDRARDWYEKAARWNRDFRPWDQDLNHFQSEAAELLGLPKPPPPLKLTPLRRHDGIGQLTSKGRENPMIPQVAEPKKSRRFYSRP